VHAPACSLKSILFVGDRTRPFVDKEKIIAVTGTNGKTTTVTLIGDMLKNLKCPYFVGGNIGLPFSHYANEKILGLNKTPAAVVVLELSSFQLESIQDFRPHVAVVVNLTFSHQERYSTFSSYQRAKFQITKNQQAEDFLIFLESSEYIDNWPHTLPMQKIPFNLQSATATLTEHYSLSQFQLPGTHNIENLFCAVKALALLGLEGQGIQQTIDTFEGVHFRVEKVKNDRAYTVYNDAKSTNIAATMKAILAVSVPEKKLYLIFGGRPRSEEAAFVSNGTFKNYVSKIFLIGETTDHLAKNLEPDNMNIVKSYTLENAVRTINQEPNFTGIILFSPGYPSFDQFENYQARGSFFEKLFQKSCLLL
jgi:UDP-N-acetylmuramoylalanine--D-glutamate ligase